MEQQQFALLASAGAIEDVCIYQSFHATTEPYCVQFWIHNDRTPKTIYTARGERREWSNLDRLNALLRRLGYTGEIRLALNRG